MLFAICEQGSMAKAAAQLSISQPAVSKAIKDMEQTLGVSLLDRTAQGVELNGYGKILLKWTTTVFDDLRQGVREIEFMADPGVGELRIGATEPVVVGILPAILERLSRSFPRLSFEVVQVNAVAQQRQLLNDRRVDLIVGRRLAPDAAENFETRVLCQEPLFVVAGGNNPWLRRKKIAWQELRDEKWSLPFADTTIGLYITEAFQVNRIEQPVSSVRSNSYNIHGAMVATGQFLSMVPGSVLRFSAHRSMYRVLPVKLPNKPSPIAVTTVKNRTISPVAELFVQTARDVTAPLRKEFG
jgi:DNA-binding transcriptional LysR family regulator